MQVESCMPVIPKGWGTMKESARYRGCLLGLAVGDAVGTAVEFRRRGTFEPVSDMVGGGPFRLRPGQSTDDTSMALCLATSLVERGGFDAADQINRYCRWAKDGYLSSTGALFDIGNTVAGALRRYRDDGNPFAGPTALNTAGNQWSVRLAPIPMFFPDLDDVERLAADSARTTHGQQSASTPASRTNHLPGTSRSTEGRRWLLGDAASLVAGERIAAIARGTYRGKPESDIRGSGYVVQSLEAALWAFAGTESFADAILAAANLGDDADTTAAVCGQVAGAYYGEPGIPSHWLDRLACRSEIAALADELGGHRCEGCPL